MANDYLRVGIDLLIDRYDFLSLFLAAGGWYILIRVGWVENVSQLKKTISLKWVKFLDEILRAYFGRQGCKVSESV